MNSVLMPPLPGTGPPPIPGMRASVVRLHLDGVKHRCDPIEGFIVVSEVTDRKFRAYQTRSRCYIAVKTVRRHSGSRRRPGDCRKWQYRRRHRQPHPAPSIAEIVCQKLLAYAGYPYVDVAAVEDKRSATRSLPS